MSDIHLDLAEELRLFAEREVAEGRFQSIGEVVEHALQLLEQRESRLAALRAMMNAAETIRPSAPAPALHVPARAR